MKILKAKGIGTQVHYIPIYSHPFFANKRKNIYKNMSNYFSQCLSIPIFYDLKKKQQDYIINVIKKVTNN